MVTGVRRGGVAERRYKTARGFAVAPCSRLDSRGMTESDHSARRWRLTSTHLIVAFGIWGLLATSLVSVVAILSGKLVFRAVIMMADGLVLFWIILGGTAMRLLRDRARLVVGKIPLDWRLKFVVFATLLALTEEAVTTTMTNLAPWFGVPLGAAYITASANYLDVVCCHSVVVFIPMFICWAWMLSRYAFSANAVFILFGLTGLLAETGSFGSQNLGNAGFWVFVYGLMVYLPAYTIPQDRAAASPRWRHYVMAILLPFVFVIPVAGLVGYLHPVKIHFPPLTAG